MHCSESSLTGVVAAVVNPPEGHVDSSRPAGSAPSPEAEGPAPANQTSCHTCESGQVSVPQIGHDSAQETTR